MPKNCGTAPLKPVQAAGMPLSVSKFAVSQTKQADNKASYQRRLPCKHKVKADFFCFKEETQTFKIPVYSSGHSELWSFSHMSGCDVLVSTAGKPPPYPGRTPSNSHHSCTVSGYKWCRMEEVLEYVQNIGFHAMTQSFTLYRKTEKIWKSRSRHMKEDCLCRHLGEPGFIPTRQVVAVWPPRGQRSRVSQWSRTLGRDEASHWLQINRAESEGMIQSLTTSGNIQHAESSAARAGLTCWVPPSQVETPHTDGSPALRSGQRDSESI